jgi:tetratricopeptide (TPR) repeat protein
MQTMSKGNGMSLIGKNKWLVLILLLTLAAYSNSLFNQFALDDFMVLKENPLVKKGIAAIPQIFANPFHTGHNTLSNDFYRPIPIALFALQHTLWGFNPLAYHTVNLLIYLLSIAIAFFTANKLFGEKYALPIGLATLLFALHPLHTELVANIKSADELLCFLFAMLSLYSFILFARQGKTTYLFGAALAFFLALLSKESAIFFIAIIPCCFYFYVNENKKRSLLITITTLLIAGLYLVLRNYILGQHNANHSADVSHLANPLALPGLDAATRYATIIYVLGYYIRLLFIPYPLVCDYSFNSIPLTSFSNPVVILCLLAYLGSIALGIYRLLKYKKDFLAFALVFFLAGLALFSNVFFLMSGIMAERFIYFASYGFCLAVGFVFSKLINKDLIIDKSLAKKPFLALFLLMVPIFMYVTYSRNKDWYNSQTLFAADLPKFPENSRLLCFLGSVKSIDEAEAETDPQKKLAIQQEAVSLLQHAISISPDYFECHTELGQTFFKMGMLDSAEKHDLIALELKPNDLLSMNELAGIAFKRKDFTTSLNLCRRILKIDDAYVTTLSNISLCMAINEKFDSALFMLRKAIQLDPDYNPNYINMAIVFKIMNQIDSSKFYEKQAQIKNPAFHLNYAK